MRMVLLLLACVSVFLAGCKKEGAPDTSGVVSGEDYFPLQKGNKWVWIGGVVPAKGDTIVWEVKDKVVRTTGKFAWNVRHTRHWEGKVNPVIDSANFVREENAVLMFMDHVDPDADTVLNYPLTPGKKWMIAHVISKKAVRTAQVIGKEDVATPYGQFKDALRVDSDEVSEQGDSLIMKMSDWYVPNVGKIMSRVEARGQVWEVRLLTAELK